MPRKKSTEVKLSKKQQKLIALAEARERFEKNSKISAFELPGITVVKNSKSVTHEVLITAEGCKSLIEGDTNDRIVGTADIKRWAKRHHQNRVKFNGMNLIRDEYGHTGNGWHRCLGLIAAQEEENKAAKLQGRKPRTLKMRILLSEGPFAGTTDTYDTGRQRRHKDAIYSGIRELIIKEIGDSDPLSESQLKTVCGDLAVMCLTVFRAVHGITIRDSQSMKLEHDVMLDFIQQHTSSKKNGISMIKHLLFCYEADKRGSSKNGGKQISGVAALPQFAAITYLAAVSATPTVVVDSVTGVGKMIVPATEGKFDDSELDKVTSFINVFARDENGSLTHPANALRDALIPHRDPNSGVVLLRDTINDMIRLALSYHLDGDSLSAKDCKITKKHGEQPFRLGFGDSDSYTGFDTSEEFLEDWKAEHAETDEEEILDNQIDESEEMSEDNYEPDVEEEKFNDSDYTYDDEEYLEDDFGDVDLDLEEA